jgi:Na+-transporting NADH:ubiquinone oxidoreductase subunit E
MPDINPILIFFAAIFTSNILLTNFLGMCSYVAISKNLKASLGLGLAVTFVSTATSVINWLIYEHLLKPAAINMGMDLTFLQFIVFIIVIAAFVQFVEMFLEKVSPFLYNVLGIFLPLITVNCAILGVSLFMIIRKYTLFQSFMFGLGSGLGWFLAIVLMAGIQLKLRFSNIPKAMEGFGIAMITTGIMAMAFMGFAGMAVIQ